MWPEKSATTDDPGMAVVVRPSAVQPTRPAVRIPLVLVPVLLAVFFSAWSWRGARGSVPFGADAAQHLLNGALIHDSVRDGGWRDPLGYARDFYTRMPAISLPYHPPGLPLIEAAVFAVFGFDYAVARAVVSAAVFVAVLLLYSLFVRTHASHALAAAATVAFFSLGSVQDVSSEVMLEMPALVFVVAALHVSARMFTGTPRWTESVVFGIVSGMAIWTKQHSMFLAGVPVVLALLMRDVRKLAKPQIVLSILLAAASAVGVMAWSRMVPIANQGWRKDPVYLLMQHHSLFYLSAIPAQLPLIAVGLLLTALIVYGYSWLREPSNPHNVYAAWGIAVFGLLVSIPPWDGRYLFFLYPPLAIIALGGCFRLIADRLGSALAGAIVVSLAIVFAITQLKVQPVELTGYQSAAVVTLAANADRVLYCGPGSGSFIYALRSATPRPPMRVIRADQLPGEMTKRADLVRRFLFEYGIGVVVVATGGRQGVTPCDPVVKEAVASLPREATVPIHGLPLPSSNSIEVIRNANVSPEPASHLTLRSTINAGGLTVAF